MATITINVYRQGSDWYGAWWVDGEYDGCDALDVHTSATEAEALEAARTIGRTRDLAHHRCRGAVVSALLVVTRHPALVDLLCERGIIPTAIRCGSCLVYRDAGTRLCPACGESIGSLCPDPERVRVISHASPGDVAGRHVIGVLPMHLAALADRVTEIPLALGPGDRGQEIGLDRLREIAGQARTYIVREVCSMCGDTRLPSSSWAGRGDEAVPGDGPTWGRAWSVRGSAHMGRSECPGGEVSAPNWQTVRVSYRGCTFAMAWNEANPQAVLYLDGRPTRYRTFDAEGRLDLAVQLLCTMKWGLCFRTREEAMAEGFKEADCTIWEDVGYEIVEDAHALLHTLVHA